MLVKNRNTLPWRLTTEFEKEQHLFSGIKSDYLINSFLCSCGDESFIVYKKQNWNGYTCPDCGNDTFNDANFAKKNFIFLIKYCDMKFDYDYELQVDDKKIRASLVTQIPDTINFLRKKINYISIGKQFLEIDYEGNIEDDRKDDEEIDWLKDYKTTYKQMEDMITNYIDEHLKELNLHLFKNKNFTLKQASFFLKHSNLKEFEFYSWTDLHYLPEDVDFTIEDAFKFLLCNKKEKSIKKALYSNHNKQIKNTKQYSISLPYVFIKKLKDPNIIVKLLKLNLYELPIAKYSVEVLIDFLLLGYSEKQIYSLFLELQSNREAYFLNDVMREIRSIENINQFYAEHEKPRCTLSHIHNKIINYGIQERKKEIMSKSLTISDHNKKLCVNVDEYKVKLPQNGKDLYNWSRELDNCISSYFSEIENQNTSIYGFFKKDILKFAVEIRRKRILQASGKYNRRLDEKEEKVLTKWFSRFFGKEKIEKILNDIPIPVEIIYG
jgi:hypothetical protein